MSRLGEMYRRMAIANLRTAVRMKKEITNKPLWFLNPTNWFKITYLNDVIRSCYGFLRRSS